MLEEHSHPIKRNDALVVAGLPDESISLQGVRTNNLKNLDISFPLYKVTVVTGVSGSGKSSLVFDTLYAEAYRRYVESLSSFVRQYLKAMAKPEIQTVSQLPPAIAVQQNRAGANNRSTVGTLTEINDLLRTIYTHMSQVICWSCGATVRKDNGQSIAAYAVEHLIGEKILILAPLSSWQDLAADELRKQLEAQGFTRVFCEGAVVKIEEIATKKIKESSVVIDRIKIDVSHKQRISDSADLALKVGRGRMQLAGEGKTKVFSGLFECAPCGISYHEPSTALLSFNHPKGACQTCQGYGLAAEIDWRKVIPDQSASLQSKGLAPFNFGSHSAYYDIIRRSAKSQNVDWKKPFQEYSPSDWEWLKKGDGRHYYGVNGYFKWLDSKKYKAHYRIHASRFRHYVTCPECEGARLNRGALACKIDGKNMAEVSRQSIEELDLWLQQCQTHVSNTSSLKRHGIMGLKEAFAEAESRIFYLKKIGVSYLSLDRLSKTLSGGELQRINMARCLGSALTDTLFCLDEPTAGLHPRDSQNLLEVITELKHQGNTVVVVEHEKVLINGADHVIEIGPDAGHRGGELIFAGTPKKYLQSKKGGEVFKFSDAKVCDKFITLKGAKTHNLKDITIRFPVAQLTAVCGVSGSGKTSLVQHTLYPMIARHFGEVDGNTSTEIAADSLGPKKLLDRHHRVLLVSQSPLGRSSRSNIATYLGVYDHIRKILASEPSAKAKGFGPGTFSFNVPGGRCEVCHGIGTVEEDLSFLGDMKVICPSCHGRRFKDEVLDIQYRKKNLIDILNLTVEQAREFFYDQKSVAKALDEVIAMGMGYVGLGQSTSSFSGGEAQRLKLIELFRESKGGKKPSILIFDEPTTGLSDRDVSRLLSQLKELTVWGHTVIVVEHHTGILKAADWLIEIGPEASQRGGDLVYEGPPEGLKQISSSLTAAYM